MLLVFYGERGEGVWERERERKANLIHEEDVTPLLHL